MLSLDELEKIAQLKGLSIKNAEKDYLQDLILFTIYSQLGEELIFKGGTCLYKIYKINRFSEDLDFTLNEEININKFTNQIISNLNLLSIVAKIKETTEYRNQTNIKLLINGPLYRGNKQNQCFIPLNISKREKIMLEPRREYLFSLYKEITTFQAFTMQEKEILAEKVRAIFTRMKPRDIYDLWFLLHVKKVDFDVQLINQKLSLYNLSFNKDFLINRIEDMKNLWLIDMKNLIFGSLPEFKIVKKEILNEIKLQMRKH